MSPRPTALAWLRAPLGGTPLLIAAALGLLLGDAAGAEGTLFAPAPAAAACAAAAFWLVAGRAPARRVAVAVLAAALGNLAAYRAVHPRLPSDHIAAAPMHVPLAIEATVVDDPETSAAHRRMRLRVARLDDGSGWRDARGDCLLTLRTAAREWRRGDIVRADVTLRRPRNFGNPGEFDYTGYLARRGLYVTAFAADDSEVIRVGRAAEGAGTWLARWRHGVGTLITRTLPSPDAAVLSALVIGTTALPDEVRTAFNRAGVSHVLSISGLHVGLVAAASYAFFRWLLARSRWLLLNTTVPKLAVALSTVPVLCYAGIAGGSVATLRALVMLLVFVAAVVVDRQRHLLVSLAAAAIIVIAISPGASLDISFQLSFVAVLGLVLGLERFWPWWRRWEEQRLVRLRGWRGRIWRPIALYAVVTCSALAATTPLTAAHFNQVSAAALVANAIVVPLLGSVAVTLGLLAALLFLISETLAHGCVAIAGPVVHLGVAVVRIVAALPYAAVRVVTPTPLELALAYAALGAAIRLVGRARTVALAVVTLALLVDGAWWYVDRYHRSDLRITFLSVGQGDAAVVEFPGSAVMVIDGGGLGGSTFDVGERIIAPFLWSRKIARIDYVVLSHPQWDHYAGLPFLATRFSPHEFWSNGSEARSARFTELRRALDAYGVRRVRMRRGARRRIGVVDVAAHAPPPQPGALSVNDRSLVLGLEFGRTRVLFTGDIETAAEAQLVAAADGNLASTILKVPHHGSHTSSSAAFVQAVAPRLAVISAGRDNRFGFPHPDVLERYATRATTVARTDRDGAVRVRVEATGAVTADTYLTHHTTQHKAIAVDSPGSGG